MAEETQFETEGDVRQYVEDNTDEAVYSVGSEGERLWFTTDDDGEMIVLLQDPEGHAWETEPVGDDFEFEDQYYPLNVTDADEVPEGGKSPMEQLEAALEGQL